MNSLKNSDISKTLSNPTIHLITSLFGSSNGSAFLNTLFDEHPDIYTFPHAISSFIDYKNFSKKTKTQHLSVILDDPIFFDTSLGNEKVRGDGFHYLGDKKNEGFQIEKIKFENFLTQILNQVEWNTQNYTLAVIMAFNYAKGIIPSSNKFMLYAHDTEIAKILESSFVSPLQIIAICRHPVNVFASICKQSLQKSFDRERLLRPITLQFLDRFYDFTKLKSSIDVVILEEIHAHPEDSMQAIAQKISIKFDSSLMKSTVAGKKWWGIRVSILNGFSDKLHLNVKVKYIGKNTEAALFRATKNFQLAAGYAKNGTVSFKDKIRSVFPGKIHFSFYPDSLKVFFFVLKKKTSFGQKAALAKQYLKTILLSFLLPLKDQQWIRACHKIDETIGSEDPINFIHRLSPESMNILRTKIIKEPKDPALNLSKESS